MESGSIPGYVIERLEKGLSEPGIIHDDVYRTARSLLSKLSRDQVDNLEADEIELLAQLEAAGPIGGG